MVSVIEGSPRPAISLTTFTGTRLDNSSVMAEWRSACMWVSVGRSALTSSDFQTRLRKLQTLIGVSCSYRKRAHPCEDGVSAPRRSAWVVSTAAGGGLGKAYAVPSERAIYPQHACVQVNVIPPQRQCFAYPGLFMNAFEGSRKSVL
jgi:hypothetical protein